MIAERPRDCTMCRECIRGEFEDIVELGKTKNHYIFTIEPIGMLSSIDIFKEALRILKEKT